MNISIKRFGLILIAVFVALFLLAAVVLIFFANHYTNNASIYDGVRTTDITNIAQGLKVYYRERGHFPVYNHCSIGLDDCLNAQSSDIFSISISALEGESKFPSNYRTGPYQICSASDKFALWSFLSEPIEVNGRKGNIFGVYSSGRQIEPDVSDPCEYLESAENTTES